MGGGRCLDQLGIEPTQTHCTGAEAWAELDIMNSIIENMTSKTGKTVTMTDSSVLRLGWWDWKSQALDSMLLQIFRCRTHYKMVSNVLSRVQNAHQGVQVYWHFFLYHWWGSLSLSSSCVQDLIYEIMKWILASRTPLTKLPLVIQINLNTRPPLHWRVEEEG